MSVSQLVLGVLASIVGAPSDVQKSMIQGAETTSLTRADIGLTSRGGEGGGIGGTSLSTRVTSTDNYSGLLVDKAFDKSGKGQSDRAQVSMSPRATQALMSSGVLSQLNTEPKPQENRTFGQAGNFSDSVVFDKKESLSLSEESSTTAENQTAKAPGAQELTSSAPNALVEFNATHPIVHSSDLSQSNPPHETAINSNEDAKSLPDSSELYAKTLDEIEGLQDSKAHLLAKNNELGAHLVSLKESILKKEGSLLTMERSINVLSKEIDQLKGSGNSEILRKKQEELSLLEAEYESSKLEIKNARGLIASQEATQINLNRVISELEEKIRNLESGLELKTARENLLLSESKVSELEQRLQTLSDAEELQKKVEQLEQELAKALGASTAELASGQKQVWVPYNASTFVHKDKLKTIASVSDAPIKKKIEEVLESYNNLLKTNFKNKMGFKTAMKPLTEDEISTIDISAIEKVKKNFNAQVQAFASVSAIQEFIRNDFTPLFDLFEDYKVKVSNKPEGFDEYEKMQTGLEKAASLVSSTDYQDFVKEFESKKGKFVEHMSNALTTADKTKIPMISSLIDMIQIDDADLSFSQFLKKYTSQPDTNDKKFTQSPYFKLGNSGLSTPFEALKLKTTTHFKTAVVTPGLEEKDVFKVLRADKASHPDIEDKHIDRTEEIYALDYLNMKWKNLALRVFDGNYENVIKDLIGATIVPANLKDVLLSLSQPDLFKKPQLVHAQNVKKLDTDLKPTLLQAQAPKWVGKEKERRDIMDIYTTYSGIIKYGNKLNSQNPKIEDFHDM